MGTTPMGECALLTYIRPRPLGIQNHLALSKEIEEKKTNVMLPLVVGLAIALGMFIGKKLDPFSHGPQSASIGGMDRHPGKVEEILRYIDARYVENIDNAELSDEAIRTIMNDLDPHSTYHSVEEINKMSESLRGNFDGIGVEFMMIQDTIFVLRVMDDGPSEKAGLEALDRIIAVEDSIVAGVGVSSNDVMKLLKGPKGTDVEVKVLRKGIAKDYTINRGRIATTSVDAAIMLDDSTGYIKLDNFSATTYADFMIGMEGLIEKDSMKNLIIDLRGNPGGYMQQATRILDQFFYEKEKTLVYTKGDKSKRYDYKTTGRNFFDVGDIAVLIDEGSASASEIIAGAVQDWDRGVIVGRRSYGKGLVQEEFPLRDGSAIRLTIARYYTPSGRCIQKAYNDSTDYRSELYDRYTNGELYESDKINIVDTTRYMTAGGRIVYAGGGVSPDVFVPLDTTSYNAAFYAMREGINNKVIRYFESNDLSSISLDDFVDTFEAPESLVREVFNTQFPIAKERQFSFASVKNAAQAYFKARLGRQLFGDNGFFAVWTKDDPSISAAMKALENPEQILRAQEF